MSNFHVTPQAVAQQAPLSVRFPGQEDWSDLPGDHPLPEDYPNPGIEHASSPLAGRFFFY